MVAIEQIQITADLLEILSEIDEFKGAWRALGTIAARAALLIGSSPKIKLRAESAAQITDYFVVTVFGHLNCYNQKYRLNKQNWQAASVKHVTRRLVGT